MFVQPHGAISVTVDSQSCLLLWHFSLTHITNFYQHAAVNCLSSIPKPSICVVTRVFVCLKVCTDLHPDLCEVSYVVGELRGWGSVCVCVKYLCLCLLLVTACECVTIESLILWNPRKLCCAGAPLSRAPMEQRSLWLSWKWQMWQLEGRLAGTIMGCLKLLCDK